MKPGGENRLAEILCSSRRSIRYELGNGYQVPEIDPCARLLLYACAGHSVYTIMLLANYRAVRKENNQICVSKISFAFFCTQSCKS